MAKTKKINNTEDNNSPNIIKKAAKRITEKTKEKEKLKEPKTEINSIKIDDKVEEITVYTPNNPNGFKYDPTNEVEVPKIIIFHGGGKIESEEIIEENKPTENIIQLSPMALQWKKYLEYQKISPEFFIKKYPNHKFIKLIEEIIEWKIKTNAE